MGAEMDPLRACLDSRLLFVDAPAPREGCPAACVFTGELNVSAHAHHSAANICPSLLSVSAAEGKQRDGEHERGSIDPLCAERN